MILAGILKPKSDSAALQKSSFDSWLLRSNWVRKRLQPMWDAGMGGWTGCSNALCSFAKIMPQRAGAQPPCEWTVHACWCATVLRCCCTIGLKRLDSPHIQLPSTHGGRTTTWPYGQLGTWQKSCLKSRPLSHKASKAIVPFVMKTGISWPLCHAGTRCARSATKTDSFGNVPCVVPTWRVQPVLSLLNDWHTPSDKDPPKWKICGNWTLHCMLSIFRCGIGHGPWKFWKSQGWVGFGSSRLVSLSGRFTGLVGINFKRMTGLIYVCDPLSISQANAECSQPSTLLLRLSKWRFRLAFPKGRRRERGKLQGQKWARQTCINCPLQGTRSDL